MIRPKEEFSSQVCLTVLTGQQNQEVERLKLKFADLFRDNLGLPPKRSVEHEIMLIGESPLPNLGL